MNACRPKRAKERKTMLLKTFSSQKKKLWLNERNATTLCSCWCFFLFSWEPWCSQDAFFRSCRFSLLTVSHDLMQSGSIALDHPDERTLGLHLLQFAEVSLYFSDILAYSVMHIDIGKENKKRMLVGLTPLVFQIVEEACTNLLPNVLCEYLYNLSENFTKFYSNCQVDLSFH